MGSSSSKVAGKAAASAAGRRQYPSTSSLPSSSTTPSPNHQHSASARVRPTPSSAPPSTHKSEHIDLDGRDPHFGSALRRIGPVMPVEQASLRRGSAPVTSTPSGPGQQMNNYFPANPAKNPVLVAVGAREKTGKLWEAENESLGRQSFAGRTLISAKEIREALKLRDQAGFSSDDIERQLRLKGGMMSRIGNRNLVANA